MRKIFITGIGTGIGKTIVSAVITEAMKADYWKPIQCGFEDGTDTDKVKSLITNTESVIHSEAFRLELPASPHAAAAAEGMEIKIKDIKAPDTSNGIIIEGAGGLMVPLNNKELMIDLIQSLNASVVVVIRHYLGSINHSLLTLEALKHRNIPVLGIVWNGEANYQSEQVILSLFNHPVIGRIGEEDVFTHQIIQQYAKEFSVSVALNSIATKK